MITQRTNDNYTTTIQSPNAHSFEIAKENQGFIIEALSKNIYRDPIGSIIREYCSNGWDANVEAGIDKPILVKIERDLTGTFFSVTDFGTGLSPDRVANVFTKYGKSTKGGDDKSVGGFGIGAKSAFSYTDTFFVNTVFEGEMYKYMLTKTSENPQMILLSKEAVEAENGSEIRLYLKNDNDKYNFLSKIKTQLLHFKSVIFQYEGNDDFEFENKETYENDEMIVSSSSAQHFSSVYAVIGPVSYPISTSLLGIPSLEIPIGLKFNIGELDVVLSREEIRYTDETKVKLIVKIEKFRKSLQEIYDDRKWSVDSIEEYFEQIVNVKSIKFGNISIKLPSSLKLKYGKYTINKIPNDVILPEAKNHCAFLTPSNFYEGGEIKSVARSLPNLDYQKMMSDSYDVYIMDERQVNSIKMKYIYSSNGKKPIVLMRRKDLKYHDYKAMLVDTMRHSFVNYREGNLFQRIKAFKTNFENPIVNKFKSFSEVEVPKSFSDMFKSEVSSNTAKGILCSDLCQPFGKGFRKVKINIASNQIFEGSKGRSLKGCVVVITPLDKFQIARKIEDNKLFKVFVLKDKWGGIVYKKVYFISVDSKKNESVILSNKSDNFNVMTLDEVVKSLKVNKDMKAYCENAAYTSLRDDRFSSFLIKNGYVNIKKLNRSGYYGDGFSQLQTLREIKQIKINEADLISTNLLMAKKKIERLKNSFKMSRFIDWGNCDFHKKSSDFKYFQDVLRSKGILPSLKSQSPIEEWEVELLEQGKQRIKYLQSLEK